MPNDEKNYIIESPVEFLNKVLNEIAGVQHLKVWCECSYHVPFGLKTVFKLSVTLKSYTITIRAESLPDLYAKLLKQLSGKLKTGK